MFKSLVNRPASFISSSLRCVASKSNAHDLHFLDKYDPQQISLLYEPMIVVDRQDHILGTATKKDVHLLSNIEGPKSMVHRAFSFFLFDSSSSPSRLLIQQRSAEKITFPSLWTNTCCSHPLYNDIELNGIDGVKHAAVRRVYYELGYELEPQKTNLTYVTRIFYQARNIPDDGIFGESEIDYILMANNTSKSEKSKLDLIADFRFNQNEVSEIKLVTLTECEKLVNQNITTPWFDRIVREGLLAKWWSALDQGELDKFAKTSDTIAQL